MAKAKVIYGTPITEKSFWAYGVTNGKAVLVRCATVEDAAEEKDRMKMSGATTVGYTRRLVAEMDMWTECRRRGWKLQLIR